MAFFSNYKKLKARIIAVLALAVTIFLLMVIAGYPSVVERFYWQGFYRLLCVVLHPVFNMFPFSVGDIAYVAAGFMLVVTVIKLIVQLFKKRFEKSVYTFLGLVAAIEAGIVIFYLFWGLNYYRPPAAQRLNLPDSVYSVNRLKTVTLMLIDSANATRRQLTAADIKQPNSQVYKTAVEAVRGLALVSPQFKTFSPGVKPSLLTPLINYLGTSGYYNPFTTEAQINYAMPLQIRPFVACHELSHQIGFGAEDEASFAGFLAGISAHDRLLKYSAYYNGMVEFMYALRGTDTLMYKKYKKRISAQVMKDLKAERAYWQYYEGRLEKVSGIFYDNYLKANNQPQGLLTYNQMVLLVIGWYSKQ